MQASAHTKSDKIVFQYNALYAGFISSEIPTKQLKFVFSIWNLIIYETCNKWIVKFDLRPNEYTSVMISLIIFTYSLRMQ